MRRTAFLRLLTNNPWRHNGTWSLSGTVWTNTPGLGSELFSNGDMETGNPPTGWSATNGTIAGVADERTGGSGVQALELTNGATGASKYTSASTLTTNSAWILASAWLKNGDVTGQKMAVLDSATGGSNLNDSSPTVSSVSWTQVFRTSRSVGNTNIRFLNTDLTSGRKGRIDGASCKTMTFNQLLVLRPGGPASTVTGKPTITAGTQAGVCAKVNALGAPTDGIFCYHDGTNIKMDKLVAGTWTNLINTAVTYSAGATIEIRPNGTNVWQAWYNGSQRGTDQTISDASIVNNNLYGGFSTYSGNTIDSLAVA